MQPAVPRDQTQCSAETRSPTVSYRRDWRCKDERLLQLDHCEIALHRTAVGARPRFWNVRPARPRCDAIVGQTARFVVNERTELTLPFSQGGRRAGARALLSRCA